MRSFSPDGSVLSRVSLGGLALAVLVGCAADGPPDDAEAASRDPANAELAAELDPPPGEGDELEGPGDLLADAAGEDDAPDTERAVEGLAETAAAVPLGKLPPAAVDAAVRAPLIKYGKGIPGGAYTNGAWFGGASVVLGVAAYQGQRSADARLLQQLRYTVAGGNEPCANGGYPAQHERHVTAAIFLARATPRVWSQLSSAERTRLDLVMKSTFLASAFTTADRNPFVASRSAQRTLDGDGNVNREWNPNYREGMLGGVLVGVAWFGSWAKAKAWLDAYDHEPFAAKLRAAGLRNAYATFTWKAAHPSSAAPTARQIEAAVRDYRYRGLGLSRFAAIYRSLLTDTYGRKVVPGLKNGAGVGGAGKLVSGASSLPNRGKVGMLKELDAVDAKGLRSSISYAYDGHRPHVTNLLVLLVGGWLGRGSDEVDLARDRLSIGHRDLWYKIDHGYVGYAKGRSQGTFDAKKAATWGSAYVRPLWESALGPYLTGG